MSNAKFVNIARLITTYNLQIDNELLPDNLKCAKCKLVLKDACAVPCGCRFCRICIDELVASGNEFCPGLSEDCGESLLSDFLTDYIANKNISKCIVRCPQNGCVQQCQFNKLEEHIRVCSKRRIECPFHEWGCQQDKLTAEEMAGHVQQENYSHSAILIGMIADINREMESHKSEIAMLKKNEESSKNEIEMLKRELLLKDGQIRTIADQLEHVENENKSVKADIKSIKLEKAHFADRVQILSEKIDERSQFGELDIINMINHVDREITAITAVIGSNKDELDTEIKSVRDDIRSINQDRFKSINDNFGSIKSQESSTQVPTVGLCPIDASYEWIIDRDVGKMKWYSRCITSEYFHGTVYPCKYRLASLNMFSDTLHIYLRIYPGPSDAQLSWPFSSRVVITVADRSKREASQSIAIQCEINKPVDNHHSESTAFKFPHFLLIQSGLDLTRGVRVSCVIVPFSAVR